MAEDRKIAEVFAWTDNNPVVGTGLVNGMLNISARLRSGTVRVGIAAPDFHVKGFRITGIERS